MKKRKIIFGLVLLILPIFLTSAGKEEKQSKKKIQIALLLDTSNSMDGLIDQAKSQLWKIVNELATADYKGYTPTQEIALYEYGNDNLLETQGYIHQLSPLSTDLDKISEDLFALKTNGGSEYCGWMIQKATQQLKWSENPNDLKMIFIAGNEAFTQGSIDYKKACKAAIAKGIIVNTIFCGSQQEGINGKWKNGADLADGKYMFIDQNKTLTAIETPYDDQILQLNKKLNKTYIYYGNKGAQMKSRQNAQDLNAAAMSKSSAVQRSFSKSSKAYKNTSWDLVDAEQAGSVDMENLSIDELPKELQGKSSTEIKAYIAQKSVERKNLSKQIQNLKIKRKAFVAKERAKETGNSKNTLDKAMLNILHEQGKDKGLNFQK